MKAPSVMKWKVPQLKNVILINYLSMLDETQLEKALNNFSVHLAEKGTNVVVKILPTQKHQQTLVK